MSTPLVSFDLDGVLIQNPFRRCVIPKLRDRVRQAPSLRDLPDAEAERRMREAVSLIWRELQQAGAWVVGYDWDHVYGLAAERLGAPPLPPVQPLVEACCREAGAIELLPDAREALELLAEQGVRMVAVTNNFARFQSPVLEALEVRGHFEAVLGPDVLGTAKPDPAVFDGLGKVAAHVGDTLSTDVAAARRAGIRSVWLPRAQPWVDELERNPRRDLSDDEWRSAWNEDPYVTLYADLTPEMGRADGVALTPLDAARLVLEWLEADG